MSDTIVEHGLTFCRIPAGPFLMGSEDGDPDERPVHEVDVGEFWLTAMTISWFDYARLMGWSPPPVCIPPGEAASFKLQQMNKIRLQYCEDKTVRAGDWHAHYPGSDESLFGRPARESDDAYGYSLKPMVAVSWQEAAALCAKLSTDRITYRLPSEAEWEKAARGGLAGKRYAWGDEPPTPGRCDFDRFDEFSIRPSCALPPNGYGLYAMCGSVWEWTLDEYDSLGYLGAPPPAQPTPPAEGRTGLFGKTLHLGRGKRDHSLRERVLRGGSWADGAEACTVSFRMSRSSDSWRAMAPNIGFRIARTGPAT